MAHVPVAFEKNQQIEVLGRGAGVDALARFPFLGGEIRAGGKICFRQGALLDAHRIDLPARLRAETHHLQGFLDMQQAQFAVRVRPVVIEHAVSQVGVLLDFAQQ